MQSEVPIVSVHGHVASAHAEDLEEIFLSRFVSKEKPHIDAERYTLLQVSHSSSLRQDFLFSPVAPERVDTLKIIDPLRQNIANFLASNRRNVCPI